MPFLKESIESNLKCMREQDELIIINDGSDDVSYSDLSEWQKYDTRIQVINRKHLGLVSALNFGITICSHEFIARADIDDTYHSDRIVKQAHFLESNPYHSAVFSDYQIRDLHGKDLGVMPTAVSETLTKFSLINPVRTPHPSVMFRKSAVIEVGGYLESEFPVEDLSLWIRLSEVSKIASIPETLLYFTLHSGSVSSGSQVIMNSKSKKLIMNFVKKIDIDKVLNDADEMFHVYDKLNEPISRKVLFLRDLLKYKKYTENSEFFQIYKYLFRYRKIMKLNTIPVILNMKKRQNLRDGLRKKSNL